VSNEHCFSAPFVSIIAPWDEVIDNKSLVIIPRNLLRSIVSGRDEKDENVG
jgi:hypothetical protein